MAIPGMNRPQFEQVLHTRLSPTTPIRSPEFLKGRGKKLEDIRKSLVSPGRHVFVYGDRGVGKTSLAQTAAFEQQSSDGNPILLTCDSRSTFFTVIRDLGNHFLASDPTIQKRVSQLKAGAKSSVITAEMSHQIERGSVPELASINQAVALIRFIAEGHSRAPVVVIDEFERLVNAGDKMLFSDFIKQISDQSVPIKLIFCGVGVSLDQLLAAHHSCYRYLTSVNLERLNWDGRLDIIKSAASAFGVTVERTSAIRIAAVSDGFPHYVHLVCEKLFWEVFEDDAPVAVTQAHHYVAAVKAAVQDIEAYLRGAYDKATKKYQRDYEEVLWAAADNNELIRRSTDIFKSYKRIMRGNDKALSRDKFNQRMNALKKPTHGSVFKATRQGWYEFRENILRGYVRLRAEEQGVQLDIDHPLESRKFIA